MASRDEPLPGVPTRTAAPAPARHCGAQENWVASCSPGQRHHVTSFRPSSVAAEAHSLKRACHSCTKDCRGRTVRLPTPASSVPITVFLGTRCRGVKRHRLLVRLQVKSAAQPRRRRRCDPDARAIAVNAPLASAIGSRERPMMYLRSGDSRYCSPSAIKP